MRRASVQPSLYNVPTGILLCAVFLKTIIFKIYDIINFIDYYGRLFKMGLMDFIKGQFIEIIEWRDDTLNTMVYKFDDKDAEIKNGAQLIVRESQTAVFFSEGQIADVFAPGKYSLTTQNLPILSRIKGWKYGFQSPFKCDVYFVSTKQFLNQKWGTTNPIMMRDHDFGVIRLRGYGMFSFRVESPADFVREVSGTNKLYTVTGVVEQLRSKIVSGVSDAIAEGNIPALDLATKYDELSTFSLEKLSPKLVSMGLQLSDFIIENLSLPEEVEAAIDTRSSMGAIGDLGKFTQYQAAQALRDAAKNEGGGLAGAGVGMGAGLGLGQMFTGAMAASQAPAAAAVATTKCIKCGAAIAANAKFCNECGAAQSYSCPKCGAAISDGAKFCIKCGEKLS